jgi:DtxR family Mn-dependent transcriptional regulator
MVYEAPEYHPAFEEYCEAIFELAEDDLEVIQARIAERLDVSRPAVSEMVKRLESEGLVTIDDTEIALTSEGQELANQVVRRHRIAERFLTDVLDLNWTDAHHEAGKWEHVISPVVEEALVRLLGEPTTCPHGNPIPGSDYTAPDVRHLVEVPIGVGFTVSRITEELEFVPGLLEFLEESALVPGNRGVVTAASPDGTD